MKIRVAYAENEQEKKRQHEAAVKRLFPDTKVKEIGLKDGFLHTVLTVPKPKNPVIKPIFVDYTPYMWYNRHRTI